MSCGNIIHCYEWRHVDYIYIVPTVLRVSCVLGPLFLSPVIYLHYGTEKCKAVAAPRFDFDQSAGLLRNSSILQESISGKTSMVCLPLMR